LVVLSLLMLFAVVGVTFVLYAQSEVTSARWSKVAVSSRRADVEPELPLAYFLGQLVYDVKDDEAGASSALRG
jgi:hypothetical protein